ncbi:MAG: aspartyl-tRNA(Asn)/glutamyl-tRNA(Gln) amidotransferase subunit [Acidobacteriota bacterium]|jgi:aspartyl-tRNA(Asn)/glutamyl-tRNA(Gln) amidotransferase subunit A|nr:aspartyl-tRNA(Asn)/glutamyl-tRNA(Gln) amidotransferase subunit [Acidobacteriota bacterium]
MNDDTFFASIDELSAQIRARKLSPVELTEGYLARLEKYGQRLGAVAHVMRAPALRDAQAAEKEIRGGHYRGVLHGIPFGVKDLLATREAPTTWGATPYKDQHFDFDGTVVQRLKNAGAILIAKLAMVELAGGMGYNEADAAWTGAGRTPWNTEYWSGGSSSGPGAATAAGLVQFAIGSETSGSILTPSAYCGVSGLRPTYGFVSRHGAMALCWTLDKLGPMCRSAADCGHVLNALAGRDPLDPTSRDSNFRYPNSKRSGGKKTPLRLAILKDSYEKTQDAVRDNFLASLEALKKIEPGVQITKDVTLPDFPYGAVVGTIVDAEGASAFRDLIESGRVKELASPSGRLGGYTASLVTAVDYLHAMRLRAPMRRAWAEMFKKYDLLVAPSRSTVANPVAKTFDQGWPPAPASSPIGASNAVGVPAISVPNGFGLMGLPTGIQFVAPAWGEGALIDIATRYQQATDWHKRRPTLS